MIWFNELSLDCSEIGGQESGCPSSAGQEVRVQSGVVFIFVSIEEKLITVRAMATEPKTEKIFSFLVNIDSSFILTILYFGFGFWKNLAKSKIVISIRLEEILYFSFLNFISKEKYGVGKINFCSIFGPVGTEFEAFVPACFVVVYVDSIVHHKMTGHIVESCGRSDLFHGIFL